MVSESLQMNINTNTASWRALESQIGNLRVVEERIQDLRSLLAEDWRLRLTQVDGSVLSSGYSDRSILIH